MEVGHGSRYRVLRELGRGGMATVYEATDEALGRPVALKRMHAPHAAHPVAAARFLREGRLAAQIRHPHVVGVFDIGVEDGTPFIVMELLEGETLAALIERSGALPLSQIVDLFLPVMSAVGTAHENGLVHRDLKPGNIMVARRSRHLTHTVVLDFGISKIMDEDPDRALTRSESVLGTVHYLSPEQTSGAKFASPFSDQYALGVMLYECATGQRPFSGASPYELMHAIVTASVRPPSETNGALSRAFDAIVMRAMDRDVGKRFPSVQALGAALLSLGGRGAWTLWGKEFTANPLARETSGATVGDLDTHGEVAATDSSSSMSSGSVSRPRHRSRVGSLAIVSCGLVTLAIVFTRAVRTGPSTPEPPHPSASESVATDPALRAVDPPAAVGERQQPLRRGDPVTSAESAAPADISLPGPSIPPRSVSQVGRRRGSGMPAPAPSHPPGAASLAAPASSPAASASAPLESSPPPRIEIGHNKAPILE